MKIAIYSRVLEEDKRNDIQFFFDEISKQNISAVVFLHRSDEVGR